VPYGNGPKDLCRAVNQIDAVDVAHLPIQPIGSEPYPRFKRLKIGSDLRLTFATGGLITTANRFKPAMVGIDNPQARAHIFTG
jgi:hypothetical protein